MFLINSSVLERHQSIVVHSVSSCCLQEVDQCFSLSCKAVDYIFVVISYWCLKEEWKIGQNWAKSFIVYFDSGQSLANDNHIYHYWHCQERVFTNVVGTNSIYTIQEDLGAILINSSLRITNKRNISDDDIMVNFVFSFRIENLVRLYGIIEHPSLRYLLGLEALVFREIFAIIVS